MFEHMTRTQAALKRSSSVIRKRLGGHDCAEKLMKLVQNVKLL
jgi:hypothetical protein